MRMRKAFVLFVALCAVCGAGAFAGEAARVGSFSQEYVLKNFEKVSIADGKIRRVSAYNSDIKKSIPESDFNVFAGLGGANTTIDMTTELVAAAAVLNIRPVEPQDALKAYAEIAIEGAVNRYLNVTGTTHKEVLDRLQAKYKFSQSQTDGAIRQYVSAEVDAQFNRVGFRIDYHNAVLTRDAQNHYTLSYGGVNTNKETRIVTANSLEALSREMRDGKQKADFTSADLTTVRAQAALMPAVVFEGWQKTTPRMVDPRELLTNALTDFYKDPSQGNYRIVRGIYARCRITEIAYGDEFVTATTDSIASILTSMNAGLFRRISKDLDVNSALIAAADIPDDPRYDIFTLTLTRAAGDAVFAKKTAPATGLLVR
jgi:hypothetical protein